MNPRAHFESGAHKSLGQIRFELNATFPHTCEQILLKPIPFCLSTSKGTTVVLIVEPLDVIMGVEIFRKRSTPRP
jgi:hypothetical protein